MTPETAIRPKPMPKVADAGLVLTDLALTPLAIDQGAITILRDINRLDTLAESIPKIPRAVGDAIRGCHFRDGPVSGIPLRGLTCSYYCHVYRMEPQNSSILQPVIAIHLRKTSSSDEAIEQIAVSCNLTERETEVLTGISQGLTTKEIAALLTISPNTVKSYIRLIMVKLGVTTRSGLVGKLLVHMAAPAA